MEIVTAASSNLGRLNIERVALAAGALRRR